MEPRTGGARPSTRARVHAAALALATEVGLTALTMEGIAARAGAGKQTLYRSWDSPAGILFDALLQRSAGADGSSALPDTGDLRRDLRTFVTGTVAELRDPDLEPLLRSATAEIQSSPDLAAVLREQLMDPQLDAVAARLAPAGVRDPREVAELLVGPLLHQWLLHRPAPSAAWIHRHVDRVVRSAGVG